MRTNGLDSLGRRAASLGKYVETWKPLPTQWNVVLRWTPSTERAVVAVSDVFVEPEGLVVVCMTSKVTTARAWRTSTKCEVIYLRER